MNHGGIWVEGPSKALLNQVTEAIGHRSTILGNRSKVSPCQMGCILNLNEVVQRVFLIRFEVSYQTLYDPSVDLFGQLGAIALLDMAFSSCGPDLRAILHRFTLK